MRRVIALAGLLHTELALVALAGSEARAALLHLGEAAFALNK